MGEKVDEYNKIYSEFNSRSNAVYKTSESKGAIIVRRKVQHFDGIDYPAWHPVPPDEIIG